VAGFCEHDNETYSNFSRKLWLYGVCQNISMIAKEVWNLMDFHYVCGLVVSFR
jgi:hypothetical protein